jgi:hypothetical protein
MIAVPCCGEIERQIPVTAAVGVISSLKNYFLSGCVFLLSTKHQMEMSMYSFIILLSLRLGDF